MKKTLFTSMIGALLLVSCNNASYSDTDKDKEETITVRFSAKTVGSETMEIDTKKKLAWIGSIGIEETACKPSSAETTMEEDISMAKAHCDTLVFAGHEDWRVATIAENKDYITQMHLSGKIPFYGNPKCPRLIGIDSTKAEAINTHNNMPLGTLTPWTTLIAQEKSSYGIKCVRDMH